jgi:hypothetical protein
MKVSILINKYLLENKISKINDTDDFRHWLELKLNRTMPRPLFVAQGKGGGQTYKTLWEVFDVLNNHNRPCYFYNENPKAIKLLIEQGHIPLQQWIDSPERSR